LEQRNHQCENATRKLQTNLQVFSQLQTHNLQSFSCNTIGQSTGWKLCNFLAKRKFTLSLMQPDKIWYQFSTAANNCFHSGKVCEAPSRVVIVEIEEEIVTKKSRVESQTEKLLRKKVACWVG
jgi:hypothetical protein